MKLGIAGRTALVCASSKGLGKACALALAREGVNVTITGRDAAALDATADEIRSLGTGPGAGSEAISMNVAVAVGDLSTEEGRRAALAACPAPDILITNNGGPPSGDFRHWTRDDWIRALDMNMLSAIDLIKATIDGMIERRFGRIVNITSSGVKNAMGMLGLSVGARAGLTGFIAGLARNDEIASSGVTINNLLPGAHRTARMESLFGKYGVPPMPPVGRLGDANDFGDTCAFLCSMQAGFITGQNLLVDGGEFRGVF